MKLTRTLLAAPIAAGIALAAAIPAHAESNVLSVGMGIEFGDSECSLGFFGFNAQKQRLAVTAGHCATGEGQTVTTPTGKKIGTVVDWEADGGKEDGSITDDDKRGYTIISIDNSWTVSPYFTSVADPSVGDDVSKFGQRTGLTNGTVTKLLNTDATAEHRLVDASMVQLPGDSGCPWFSKVDGKPVLRGISSSGNFGNAKPTEAVSQAQTISALYELITSSDDKVTDGFKIWVTKK